MKRRNTTASRSRIQGNARRRQLLKRLHQKVMSRRQHYQALDLVEEMGEAC